MKFYIAEGGYYGQVCKRHIKEFKNEKEAKEWCASECDWIAYWVEGPAPDNAPLGLIYSSKNFSEEWEEDLAEDLGIPAQIKPTFQQDELKPAFQPECYHWIWCDSCENQRKQYLVSGNNIPTYCTCGAKFKFSTEQFCEHGIILNEKEKCCVCEWKGKPIGDGTSFEKKRV